MIVATRYEYGSEEAQGFARRLRSKLIPAAGFPAGVAVRAGGGPPQGVDFLDRAYCAFPWLVLGVLALTYLLLMRAFRSILLPLKAVILNLLSVAAAYGALEGFMAGSIVGLQEFGCGLAVAIFLDATLVRAVLVPALMAIMGRYNWWLPAPLARLVRVRPSPLRVG